MSEKPVELIPLLCTNCQIPVPAAQDEVAWACEQCGQGLILAEDAAILPIDIHYSDRIPQDGEGKPFWVVEGHVSLQRETHSGDESRQMVAFWSDPRQFFIPAYHLSTDQALKSGTHYTLNPPVLQDGPPIAFHPITTRITDIRSMAEFIILTIEAERKDYLKELHIQLELGEPVLWILN